MLNKAHPNIHVLINVFKKLEAKYEILNYNLRNREQFTLANRFTSGQITLANRFTSEHFTLANRFTSEQILIFKKSRTNSKANSLHMRTKN